MDRTQKVARTYGHVACRVSGGIVRADRMCAPGDEAQFSAQAGPPVRPERPQQAGSGSSRALLRGSSGRPGLHQEAVVRLRLSQHQLQLRLAADCQLRIGILRGVRRGAVHHVDRQNGDVHRAAELLQAARARAQDEPPLRRRLLRRRRLRGAGGDRLPNQVQRRAARRQLRMLRGRPPWDQYEAAEGAGGRRGHVWQAVDVHVLLPPQGRASARADGLATPGRPVAADHQRRAGCSRWARCAAAGSRRRCQRLQEHGGVACCGMRQEAQRCGANGSYCRFLQAAVSCGCLQ